MSLRYVSVSFNQIMRATVPAVTMLLSGPLLKETFSGVKKVSMAVVILGVMVACYGDIEFTAFGFTITLVAIIAAAVKAVVSSMILGGEYKLHPLDFLYRMSSFASFESFIWALFSGEVETLVAKWDDYSPGLLGVVGLTGAIAFFLNLASFYVNKITSALTLTIVANVKQVVVIVLAVIVFHTPVTLINGAGVVVVILGSIWYSVIGYQESETKKGKEREKKSRYRKFDFAKDRSYPKRISSTHTATTRRTARRSRNHPHSK